MTGKNTNWLMPVMSEHALGLGKLDARGERPQQQEVHCRKDEPDQGADDAGTHHAIPVSLRKAAVMITMASEIGRNTFQPSRISWS